MIIGINGKIGSGKDTVGKIIQYLVDFYTLQKDFPDAATDLPDNPNKEDFDEWLYNMGDSEENNVWEIKKFAGKLKQFASMLTGISVEDLEKEEVKNSVLGEEWTRWYCEGGYTGSDYYKKRITPYFCNEKEALYYKESHKLFSLNLQDGKLVKEIPTVRQLLQQLGTEAIRNNIHENAWVNALMVDYKKELTNGWIPSYNNPDNHNLEPNAELEYPNWIITDMRFPNDLKAVKDKNGISICIQRDTPCRVCKLTQAEKKGATCNEITCPLGQLSHISETALDLYKFDYIITNNGTINELINKVKEILIKEKII